VVEKIKAPENGSFCDHNGKVAANKNYLDVFNDILKAK
jgi:hypothetical protein